MTLVKVSEALPRRPKGVVDPVLGKQSKYVFNGAKEGNDSM